MARIFSALFLMACLVASALAQSVSDAEDLSQAALERTQHRVVYDSSYRSIDYPGGDVDPGTGVCSDVVIRSFRSIDVDLQVLVHEDMKSDFSAYPGFWGLKRPDSNIDHRRVPNLRRFFERRGADVAISSDADVYLPGDIVTWNLRRMGSLPHIGIVTDQMSEGGVPMIVHNVGQGPQLEDVLFAWSITGHYRYDPGQSES